MDSETRHRLNVLSKELNELLNALYESSKTNERVTPRLILRNTCILLWRKLRSVKGIITVFGVSVAGIMAYIAEVFHHLIQLPMGSLFVLCSIYMILASSLIRILVLNEMSNVDSDLFHLGVYEKRKKKEFFSLISMAKQKDYILILKEQVEKELSGDREKLGKELAKYKSMLEQKNQILEEKNNAIEKKNVAIHTLLEELDQSEEYAIFFKEKSEYLIDVLFQLKSKLNQLLNDQFHLENINVGANYTLYRKIDKGLFFIGGYGVNKAEFDEFIPFNAGKNKYIQSINRTQTNPFMIDDFISWKRTLQDGSEWILSLHLDASNREKLSNHTEMGKLNLTITQEVLWICCELLNKFVEKNGNNIRRQRRRK
ncbi:hypothetical protein J2S74_002170 [Evansella vedderi]|uniref:Uncharacterized protein n=1 Tax=Evansella vedderi TaxID=38282 RepID=A0ABT9ZU74_9BACI|nr:hypothetical protein [Evansella vedderi]MDQ0254791.1 hypothetical protein [Evansella vedderi]